MGFVVRRIPFGVTSTVALNWATISEGCLVRMGVYGVIRPWLSSDDKPIRKWLGNALGYKLAQKKRKAFAKEKKDIPS